MPPIVLSLANGREVMLRGRIDRIDRYDAPDAVYLRVIDYKSAQQSLDAARTWWGLQLQLLLYLDVCTAAIENGKPAGAFYFYVADPLVESDTDLAPVVEAKLRDVFQLRGITLTDVEILNAMDSGETPCVLPPVYLKSGELRKNAKALDMAQFTGAAWACARGGRQPGGRAFRRTHGNIPRARPEPRRLRPLRFPRHLPLRPRRARRAVSRRAGHEHGAAQRRTHAA